LECRYWVISSDAGLVKSVLVLFYRARSPNGHSSPNRSISESPPKTDRRCPFVLPSIDGLTNEAVGMDADLCSCVLRSPNELKTSQSNVRILHLFSHRGPQEAANEVTSISGTEKPAAGSLTSSGQEILS
jgi:hypothetical protein